MEPSQAPGSDPAPPNRHPGLPTCPCPAHPIGARAGRGLPRWGAGLPEGGKAAQIPATFRRGDLQHGPSLAPSQSPANVVPSPPLVPVWVQGSCWGRGCAVAGWGSAPSSPRSPSTAPPAPWGQPPHLSPPATPTVVTWEGLSPRGPSPAWPPQLQKRYFISHEREQVWIKINSWPRSLFWCHRRCHVCRERCPQTC